MSEQFPTLPSDLIPVDPRFGCGPSKVRPEQIQAIVAGGEKVIGTSHRQAAVKDVVGNIREGLSSLFNLPEGYEIVLSLGGATAFWDAATFALIEKKSGHLSFGEFSSKFAKASKQAPWLDEPTVIEATPAMRRSQSLWKAATSSRGPTTKPRPEQWCRSCARRAPRAPS